MTHFDIALIGSGSGNSFPGPEFAGRSIAYIDRGVGPNRVFGGTCLNLGCIPTKMFVKTADLALDPSRASRFGLTETLDRVDWPAIRDRIFGRIDPIRDAGLAYRENHADNDNITLFRGTAHFIGPKELVVDLDDGGTARISADVIVLGAGSRPILPPVPGLAEAHPLTSDTIMRLDRLPTSLAILGSGVIAAEFAHIMHGFGVDVTILARHDRLLRHEDDDISRAFTEAAEKQTRVVTGFEAERVEHDEHGVRIIGGHTVIEAEALLVATGRIPNSDLLEVSHAGIGLDHGRVRVDHYQRVLDDHGSVIDGVWAFGDLSSPAQLKHVANHEQRVMRHNILHPDDLQRSDLMPIPHGIFGDPQIASVGLTETQARTQAQLTGRPIAVAHQDYSGVAYGWALEDTTSFAKIIVEQETTAILGAHIIGPEATILIQQLIQAMSTGQTARDIARTQYWIHPALPEVIENALLQVAG